jgi:membrane associated rhomboid family serine protease
VIAFLAELTSGSGTGGLNGTIYQHGALYGPLVADGDWWRIVTAGFLHAGLLHIAFNMYFLYFMGRLLEPAIGKLRFGLIYFVSLLGGSFGALVASPNAVTVGASGAVFGLLGAAILVMRSRGISPMQSGLGMTLILNLGITLAVPGISIGGHVGGLASGGVVAYLLFEVADRRPQMRRTVTVACALLGLALAAGAIAIA